MDQEWWHEDGEEKSYPEMSLTTRIHADRSTPQANYPEFYTNAVPNAPRNILAHDKLPVETFHEISDHDILQIFRKISF